MEISPDASRATPHLGAHDRLLGRFEYLQGISAMHGGMMLLGHGGPVTIHFVSMLAQRYARVAELTVIHTKLPGPPRRVSGHALQIHE
jgi:hypothetical protein